MRPFDKSDGTGIAAVGDLMFDRRLVPPRMFFHQSDVTTCTPGAVLVGVPFHNTPDSRSWVMSRGVSVDAIDMTAHATTSLALDLPGEADAPEYPFATIRDELRRAALVFGNLECPLSKRGRRIRNDVCYSADPGYAAALAAAPFHVLSFANNHCMDFGEVAFRDTLELLRAQGIAVVGAGHSLEEARRPAPFDLAGTRVAFLAYTMAGHDSIFACDGECGAVPLNPFIVEQDVRRVRSDVDVVIVSVHWGGELMTRPWPWLVGFAHRLVDCGADVLLGHHPHVPGSIEIYNGRPIFYSLGNFCFGHGHVPWGDNMIARLLIDDRRVQGVEVTGIAGTYQPRRLDVTAAAAFHQHLIELSRPFGTRFTLQGGRSYVMQGD